MDQEVRRQITYFSLTRNLALAVRSIILTLSPGLNDVVEFVSAFTVAVSSPMQICMIPLPDRFAGMVEYTSAMDPTARDKSNWVLE